MARFLAQIIMTGAQVVGRAFARAVKQEMAESQEAARRLGNTRGRTERLNNIKLGLSLDEAKKILNIDTLDKEQIDKNYEHLFQVNDKQHSGSFYIQSKVVRAKERLDHEFSQNKAKEEAAPEAADNKT